MIVEIDIIDRIYHNIQEFCEINGFNIIEYMSDAIVERYNLDKYGDLNEKLVKKEEEKKLSTRRNKETEIIANVKDAETVSNIKVEEVVTEKLIETKESQTEMDIQEEEKPKKTRRTLKTK